MSRNRKDMKKKKTGNSRGRANHLNHAIKSKSVPPKGPVFISIDLSIYLLNWLLAFWVRSRVVAMSVYVCIFQGLHKVYG